jgi:hypothetical protein
MRKFFGIDSADRSKDSTVGSTSVDDLSCISSCSLGSGSVKNSLLSNVHCNQIDAEGCVLINVTANKITAKEGCIIYNIADGSAEGLDIIAGKVLAGVFSKDGSHKQMHSSIDTDGGMALLLLSSVLYSSLYQRPAVIMKSRVPRTKQRLSADSNSLISPFPSLPPLFFDKLSASLFGGPCISLVISLTGESFCYCVVMSQAKRGMSYWKATKHPSKECTMPMPM